MSYFKHSFMNEIEFNNGYRIAFWPEVATGTVGCSLRYKGEGVILSKFMTSPGKGDSYCSYLSPEDFAEVLYRASTAEEATVDWSQVTA